ncbi:phage baseplate assembly protein V [Gloeocapsopsis dulcis]|uniref:Baseplate assembly protein n=1 Tax=Gloeocapsopsis dulcis AAB1 = 1H9 TaxID=1433147 RepID=A0A6N8FN98_9CHRO|nr:phage baseplate assembly protein V [Gloeocapsopsis dulcis]MUL34948.1 baseplate assembly protein [Gloeocapsopsis dulcis AAB1 = 1H9]WNN89980.1 phage baseplate assembly protein V [Gloeocapsopsis dulcis]
MNESNNGKFYGKYRGTVVNNIDPLQMGRLILQIPDVLSNTPCTWAMPCLPVAGQQMGMYVIPPINAGVWVEFEQGDPDHPIWVGCWWGNAAEVPSLALAAPPAIPNIVLQTTGQNTILISDVPGPTGGIMLKSTTGAMILVNDTGITISNGKGATIVMAGPTITINNGALTIT